jgi:hypothetical protein
MRAKDAGMRCRCKVVLALVQGTTPTMIAQGGLCAKSQVYRVAGRFITEGLIHLILDNYGIHDSLQVRLAMKSAAFYTPGFAYSSRSAAINTEAVVGPSKPNWSTYGD